MSDSNVQAEFGRGSDQSLAVCGRLWTEKNEPKAAKMKTSQHVKLAKLIRKRSAGGLGIVPIGNLNIVNGCASKSARLAFEGNQASIKAYARDKFEDLLPEGIKAPPHTLMVFHPVITTPKQDRDGDILETSGAVVAKRNTLLWQHDANKPLGKMVAVIEHSPDVLKFASALLALKGNEALADDAAMLIEAGALGISHGFRALEWDTLKDDKGNETGGFHVTKFEQMEHSLVSVESNTDAIIEQYSRGKLASREAKDLPEQADEKRPKSYKAAVAPKQNKMMGGYLGGSWEHIEHELNASLPKHLAAHGVKMAYGISAMSVGTYADHAIVAVMGRSEDGAWHEFYRVPWAMDGEMPKWSGPPERVSISTVVEPVGEAAFQELATKRCENQQSAKQAMTADQMSDQWFANTAAASLAAGLAKAAARQDLPMAAQRLLAVTHGALSEGGHNAPDLWKCFLQAAEEGDMRKAKDDLDQLIELEDERALCEALGL